MDLLMEPSSMYHRLVATFSSPQDGAEEGGSLRRAMQGIGLLTSFTDKKFPECAGSSSTEPRKYLVLPGIQQIYLVPEYATSLVTRLSSVAGKASEKLGQLLRIPGSMVA